MKKLFFMLALVAISVLSYGQDNQLVWANGRLLYGTPIVGMDSLTYDRMEDVDTLHLLLPRTLIKVEHDTVYIHDTINLADQQLTNIKLQTLDATLVSQFKATLNATAQGSISITDSGEYGFIYSKDSSSLENGVRISCDLGSQGVLIKEVNSLQSGSKYFYMPYFTSGSYKTYGEIKSFITTDVGNEGINLSETATSNCYIITAAGDYKINVSEYTASSAFLLWNENGADDISNVYLDGDFVHFTKNSFNEGNAVISIADASGSIVWSWHIWTTDMPQFVTIDNRHWMDRNIGATSTSSSDDGVYGLLFTPGNPFPFPGPKYTSTWSITSTPSVPDGWYVADGYGFYSSSKMPTPATPMQLCTRTDVYGNSIYYRNMGSYSQVPAGCRLPSSSVFQSLIGYEPTIVDNGVYANANLYIPCIYNDVRSTTHGRYLCSGIYNSAAVATYAITFYDGVSKQDYCVGASLEPIRCYKQ